MRQLSLLVLCVPLCAPAPASAGALYGTVRLNQNPAPGLKILVACPGFGRSGGGPPSDAQTDGRGSFSIRVTASGRCQMQVQRNGQTGAPFDVFVSNNAMRLDIELNASLNRMP